MPKHSFETINTYDLENATGGNGPGGLNGLPGSNITVVGAGRVNIYAPHWVSGTRSPMGRTLTPGYWEK